MSHSEEKCVKRAKIGSNVSLGTIEPINSTTNLHKHAHITLFLFQ